MSRRPGISSAGTDPVGGEAGYEQVVARAQEQLKKTGATWIATTDYRTYAMMRWYFNGRVPVIQINERGRYQGFRDPGMDRIRDHTGLYVAREPDNGLPLWDLTTAKREPLERVERSWRGVVMDTYALEKLTGWTPELSPPPDTPLFRWRVLADNTPPRNDCGRIQMIATSDVNWEKPVNVYSDRRTGAVGLRIRSCRLGPPIIPTMPSR